MLIKSALAILYTSFQVCQGLILSGADFIRRNFLSDDMLSKITLKLRRFQDKSSRPKTELFDLSVKR